MAFDGIMIAGLAKELNDALTGGRITKIAQPEKDELLFTIKNYRDTYRLLLSANPGLPLIYLTESSKQSPMTAPNFCMLLRKHIGGGRILSVSQPGLERIIHLEIEHLDEMGDLCRKRLIVEMMGKHSNIIFVDGEDRIIDSIRHVSAQLSSVREVLPGRTYFIPQTVEKFDPFSVTEEEFSGFLKSSSAPASKTLYTHLTGISPIMAEELCHMASVDADRSASMMSEAEITHLHRMFTLVMDDVRAGHFSPVMILENQTPVEFSALPLSCFEGGNYEHVSYDSVSRLLEDYYASKNTVSRIRQKSVDLRKIVQTALERNYKKYDLQLKQLKDTEKREKYRIYGELLNTYGYELTGGEKEFTCFNYYANEDIKIPLDPQLTAKENAQKHFDRYNKLKRTYEALSKLTEETAAQIEHLESISAALDIALKEEDLTQIKEELQEFGYIKKRGPGQKKARVTSRPFHYISSDGFHIYVGKNNYQNEEVSFKIAGSDDWWFHAKGIPGSHVIVKSEGKELPDRVFEEAGALAAYYSKGRNSEKVEVDYLQRRGLKKVTGGAPGFVIYHSNYSLMAVPKLELKEADG